MGYKNKFAEPAPSNSTLQSKGPAVAPPEFGLSSDTAPLQKKGDGSGSKNKPGMPKDDSYSYGKVKDGVLFNKGAGDKDEIALNDVEQGALADCYFLAALGAIAQSNPDAIRKTITDNGDGTFNVQLFGDKGFWTGKREAETFKVTPDLPLKADGTPAYADLGDGPELWVALIEKAFAMREGGYDDIEWGNAGTAMEILSGNESETVYTASLDGATILSGIKAKLDAKKPVTVSSKDFGDSKKKTADADKAGVVGKHVYVVESVDVKKKTIDLYNPWGSGHQRGLSIADFKKYYRRYQTTK